MALAGRFSEIRYLGRQSQASHFQLQKAVGDPAGLAELMVFYCEQASGFASDIGYQDESYFNALVRTFEQAVATAKRLPTDTRDALIASLDRVRSISLKCGYGIGDGMDSILAKYPARKDRPSQRRYHPSRSLAGNSPFLCTSSFGFPASDRNHHSQDEKKHQ